ncbi:MAG: HD domain-containing phosphohydrolase [Solirubrobacteraceae bacterium]
MKLSVPNKAGALLAVVIVLVLLLGVFALAELHIADSAINQAAADAGASTSGAGVQIHSLASASHSRLQLSYLVIVVLVLAIVTGAIATAMLLERRLNRATEKIGSAARAISSGEITEPIDVVSRAQYGNVADQFSSMVEYLRGTVEVAEKVAGGDLTVEVVPRSEQDSLGKSIATMARALRQLTRDNERLLAKDRERATLDSLTGLPNRVALMRDLESSLNVEECPDMTLALFDLDGFKPYNDAFSHAAGDALLVRLAERLRRALDGSSVCYRMGGDEFCVLVTAGEKAAKAVARRAARALSEQGEAFSVSCSFGTALLPREAHSASDALRLADKRMYEQKLAHASVSRESTTLLLQMLGERNPDLIERASVVAELAVATAQELGLAETEIARIELAAKLRDVGKSAIPDMILNKPGPLDDEEWVFMRRHTQIGARIISAAPSLAGAAELVRSHHEWYNGKGYPDLLAGDAIPVGAQIIAVCDAFGAMISDRAYRSSLSEQEALDELNRCAGTQFSPPVVRTFAKLMGRRNRPVSGSLRALG